MKHTIKSLAAIAHLSLLMMVAMMSAAYADHHANDNPTNLSKSIQKMVTLKTNHGDITLELDAENAPVTVENFLQYVKDGHYDGLVFHRVIPQFMIQGGGFEPGMKQKAVRAPIPNEANNGLLNNKYTIAMARTSDPHSASSQFFINAKDNDFLNFSNETQQGWGYAVFGKVVSGQEVVDEIESVQTGNGDVPLEDVVIESAVIAD